MLRLKHTLRAVALAYPLAILALAILFNTSCGGGSSEPREANIGPGGGGAGGGAGGSGSPGSPFSPDVVLTDCAFTFPASDANNKEHSVACGWEYGYGDTATHEVGHWLGLYESWPGLSMATMHVVFLEGDPDRPVVLGNFSIPIDLHDPERKGERLRAASVALACKAVRDGSRQGAGALKAFVAGEAYHHKLGNFGIMLSCNGDGSVNWCYAVPDHTFTGVEVLPDGRFIYVGSRIDPLSYELKPVYITSWSTSGDAYDRPTEEFSLNFEEIKAHMVVTDTALAGSQLFMCGHILEKGKRRAWCGYMGITDHAEGFWHVANQPSTATSIEVGGAGSDNKGGSALFLPDGTPLRAQVSGSYGLGAKTYPMTSSFTVLRGSMVPINVWCIDEFGTGEVADFAQFPPLPGSSPPLDVFAINPRKGNPVIVGHSPIQTEIVALELVSIGPPGMLSLNAIDTTSSQGLGAGILLDMRPDRLQFVPEDDLLEPVPDFHWLGLQGFTATQGYEQIEFVVNTHTSPFDLSVFGFTPEELRASAE